MSPSLCHLLISPPNLSAEEEPGTPRGWTVFFFFFLFHAFKAQEANVRGTLSS